MPPRNKSRGLCIRILRADNIRHKAPLFPPKGYSGAFLLFYFMSPVCLSRSFLRFQNQIMVSRTIPPAPARDPKKAGRK